MADERLLPGETLTANYGWTKPDVGGSGDAWGGEINADLDGIDSVVHGIQTSIPAASSTAPAMDGTAAVGTGTTWARADHVHPTDTSRYAASNPSGYQTAAQVAAVVIGDNRVINGAFAVNQRAYASGTALAAAAYGHDRWKAGTGGCTYTFPATLPDTTVTITAGTLTQIIEAAWIEGGVYTLSWTGTAQARVYQGTPTGAYAASPLTTASLTAGTNTIVEFNAGTLTRVKLEIGAVATPFNRQSLAKNQADCERYFRWLAFNMEFLSTAANAVLVVPVMLSPVMRAAPTFSAVTADPNYTGPTSTNISQTVFGGATAASCFVQLTATASGLCYAIGYRASASAEL